MEEFVEPSEQAFKSIATIAIGLVFFVALLVILL